MPELKNQLIKEAIEHYEGLVAELSKLQNDLLKTVESGSDTLDLQDQSHIDETTRTVEWENHQILEAQKELEILKKVKGFESKTEAEFGAIVETDSLNFFIAAPVNKMAVGGKQYIGISIEAPIFQNMKGKKIGETFSFNQRQYSIKSIY